jgi:ERCC4-type nuclease
MTRMTTRATTAMLISPSEPAELRAIGTVSSLPERYGADILMIPHESWGGWLGVQRKELRDLLASLADGRLGEQVLKMKRCARSMIVVEGRMKWAAGGELVAENWGRPLTRDAWNGIKWTTTLANGCQVDYVDDLAQMCEYLVALEKWAQKDAHDSLFHRPGPAGAWGRVGAKDWERHILASLPGIGPKLAGRIIETVGMPLRFGVSAEVLATVPGMGAAKVRRVLACFPQEVVCEEPASSG